MLMGQSIAAVTRVRRRAGNARNARDKAAAALSPARLARRLPPLLRWIPSASPHLSAPTHLAPIAEQLERVARGETIRLCFSVPPRHGKTTLTVHWLVWLLAQRPDIQILYCAYGTRLAKKQTRAMRTLARRIGLPLGEIQTATEWTTASGGRVLACGITGAPMGDGFHVIVVDDPHRSRQGADSPTECATTVTAYRDDIYTRQLPEGTSHIILATRWNVHDLTGVMTEPKEVGDDNAPDPFDLINLPALDDDGNALAPWLWSAKYLHGMRRTLGPFGWASLFMGRPMPRGGGLFGAPTWTDDEPREAGYGGGCDLARTAKRRSDHQAGVMMARRPDGMIVIVDAEHERALLTDRTTAGVLEEGFGRRLHGMQRRRRGASIRMYTARDEQTTLDLLATHHTYPVYVRGVVARTDKWERAQPFAAAWNAGRVLVLSTCRDAMALVRQLENFTGMDGDSDDLVDAAVAAFDEVAGGPIATSTVADYRTSARPATTAARQRWT